MHLAGNRLTGELGGAFRRAAPSLTHLHLDDNHLSGEVAGVLAGATELRELTLSNNRFTDTADTPVVAGVLSKLGRAVQADVSLTLNPKP